MKSQQIYTEYVKIYLHNIIDIAKITLYNKIKLQAGFPCAASPNLSRERAHQSGNCCDYIIREPCISQQGGAGSPQITKIFRLHQPKNFVNIVFKVSSLGRGAIPHRQWLPWCIKVVCGGISLRRKRFFHPFLIRCESETDGIVRMVKEFFIRPQFILRAPFTFQRGALFILADRRTALK